MKKISLIERIRRNAFCVYRNAETELHELRSVLWECTLKCSLNCGHCGSDCKASCTVEDADKELFFKALDDIKTVYQPEKVMIGITGGEPLMRADLPEIIKHIHEKGFPVGIVSNGMAMTLEKFVELINAGLNTVTFSLDGPQEEHNKLRNNPNSFKCVYNAIKNASLFEKQTKGKVSFDFDVVTCVQPSVVSKLPEVKKLLIDAGVKHWRIFSIFPSGRAGINNYSLNSSEYLQVMEFIKEEREKNEIDVSFSCEGWLGPYEGKVRPSYYFCRAGITNAGIFVDGKVGGCISVRSQDFIAGDLHTQSFMDIWENNFSLHRNRSWAHKGMCKDCKDFKHCLGNGLHLYQDINSEPAQCSLKLINNQ